MRTRSKLVLSGWSGRSAHDEKAVRACGKLCGGRKLIRSYDTPCRDMCEIPREEEIGAMLVLPKLRLPLFFMVLFSCVLLIPIYPAVQCTES